MHHGGLWITILRPIPCRRPSAIAASSPAALPDGALLAAVDIGSNSFHLIVGRIEHGELRPVETRSEKVQLGAGLVDERLCPDAIARGLDCLARFRQVLDTLQPRRVRAVATNTLRIASNRREFTHAAQRILGVPVDVIYGREEARLIYLGVAHTLADDGKARLVVDIGGGSTELIVGERFEPRRMESLQLGSVAYGQRFFPGGRLSRKRYLRAFQAASLEVSHIRRQYSSRNWQDCVGSSGTFLAIENIIRASGWDSRDITPDGLRRLADALLRCNHVDELKLEGLSESRRNVIVPGVAIASAIFDTLSIDRMRTSTGALREGTIYDLIGRLGHEDVRERTVKALVQRYGADSQVIERVEQRAASLFQACQQGWQLKEPDWQLLRWTAACHEIGMAISHKNYHRHGAYLLRNSDLPGFSQYEQQEMALLVAGHRRKLARELLAEIPAYERDRLLKLLVLLRLAVLFRYSEELDAVPELTVEPGDRMLRLQFPGDWLAQHPLTVQELAQEKAWLQKLDFTLQVG